MLGVGDVLNSIYYTEEYGNMFYGDYYGFRVLGSYWDNGKEMETTIVYGGYIGFRVFTLGELLPHSQLSICLLTQASQL